MRNRLSSPHPISPSSLLATLPMLFALLLLSLLTTSCSTQQTTAITQQQNSSAVYKADIQLTVNGQSFNGVGVIPKAASYNFVITSSVDVDMLTISTCGRDFTAQAAIKTNWLHPHRSYSYLYTPEPGVESQGSCILRIGAFNEAKGQNAWGYYDFQTGLETMGVQQMCNGETTAPIGVSMCQTKVGIITQLVFSTKMLQDTTSLNADGSPVLPAQCVMSTKDGLTFTTAQNSPGECVSAFIEVAKPHVIHRHTERRYTDVLIRE